MEYTNNSQINKSKEMNGSPAAINIPHRFQMLSVFQTMYDIFK